MHEFILAPSILGLLFNIIYVSKLNKLIVPIDKIQTNGVNKLERPLSATISFVITTVNNWWLDVVFSHSKEQNIQQLAP